MRVLVTGGLGFVGSAVATHLYDEGHDVTVLTHRPFPGIGTRGGSPPPEQHPYQIPNGIRIAVADIRDRTKLAEVIDTGGFDGVCHLAALTRVRDSFKDPIDYFDVNVTGTLNLLRALDAYAVRSGTVPRLIFGSTGAVYGPAEGRIDEDHPTRPTNPYGASKLAAEQAIKYQAQTRQLDAVVLRSFNISGAVRMADSDTTRIIPKALAVAAGRFEHVEVNGDGTAVREYTHVADVASAFRLSLERMQSDEYSVFNIGAGQPASVADIIAIAEQVTGRSVPVHHNPPHPEPQIMISGSDAINRYLTWRAQCSDLTQMISDAWAKYAH